MIQRIPAEKRHFSDFGWLHTYWLFSFAHYYDPENVRFGALRVFNDDVVAPGTGFPTHPHREMEIVTIVLSGEVTHRDSLGNTAVIGPGDVQRMSAGTGIAHSEFNLGRHPAHFYQIWIDPDRHGLPPTYDQRRFDPRACRNRLLPVASGQGHEGAVTFHADGAIYLADLDAGASLRLPADPSRRLFVYMTAGEADVGGVPLQMKDQARVDPDGALSVSARAAASLVLVDVPSCRGFGYGPEILRGARE